MNPIKYDGKSRNTKRKETKDDISRMENTKTKREEK